MSHTPNNPCDWNGHLTDWWFTRGGVCDQYLCLPSLFQKLPANKYWSRYITFFVLFFGVLNLSSKNWPQIDIDLTALLFKSDMFVYFFQVIFNSLWINDSLNHVMIHYIITKYSSANFSMVKFLVKKKHFTIQNVLLRGKMTKIKELKFKMLLSWLPFF